MKYVLNLSILTILFTVSCKNNTTEKTFINGKQVPIINSPLSKISIVGIDSLLKDQEFCAHIIQTRTDLKLVSAYIGSYPDNFCDFSKSYVDTTLRSIDNCSIQLGTLNDTANFCLTPNTEKSYLYKVAVLSIDKNTNYYLDTLDMRFDVRGKTNP